MSKRAMSVSGFGNNAKQRDKICTTIFQGETMKCVICGIEKQSDPNVSSDWRAVDIDGKQFFACKQEFPPDGIGTTEAFEAAYRKFLKAAIIKMRAN